MLIIFSYFHMLIAKLIEDYGLWLMEGGISFSGEQRTTKNTEKGLRFYYLGKKRLYSRTGDSEVEEVGESMVRDDGEHCLSH